MTDVTSPMVRLEVVSAVAALSDTEYQQRVWLRHEPPLPGYDDCFDFAVHALYDDTMVAEDPEDYVGHVLFTDEVDAMHALNALLHPLIRELGNVPDEQYLGHPTWPAVVLAARAARHVMERNGGYPEQLGGLTPGPPGPS